MSEIVLRLNVLGRSSSILNKLLLLFQLLFNYISRIC